MIHSPNFAKCLQETEFTFHCVWYIEPVYSTGRVAISQKANEIQFEFPTKMIGKMVVHNATIQGYPLVTTMVVTTSLL